jgi:hypothetical protein
LRWAAHFRDNFAADGDVAILTALTGAGLSAKMSGIILKWEETGMDQLAGLMGSRRNEDIALDMMKFIAATTGYGRTGAPGAGFQGGTVNKAEDYAEHLLDLYTRCLNTVNGKK